MIILLWDLLPHNWPLPIYDPEAIKGKKEKTPNI